MFMSDSTRGIFHLRAERLRQDDDAANDCGLLLSERGPHPVRQQRCDDTPPNKRNTGMVFQNYALFPHMTVFENIAFGLQVRKVAKSDIVQRVERAQKQVHLRGTAGAASINCLAASSSG